MNVRRRVGLLLALLLPMAWTAAAFASDPEPEGSPGPNGEAAQIVRVAVDPRVELLGTVFRLTGSTEYSQGRVQSYVEAIERQFGPFREHAAIFLAARLRQEHHIGFDAPMSLAIHLNNAFEPSERSPFDAADTELDRRWRAEDARKLVIELRSFVQDADFRSFIEAHRPLFEIAENRLRDLVDTHANMAWFGEFFGSQPERPFTIIPAPINGGGNYGIRYREPDGPLHLYAIIGVAQVDAEGLPTFDPSLIKTIVHEVNHSFVNSLVEQHRERFRQAGEAIYELVKEPMELQAYGDWIIMINESLVRAAVTRYVLANEGPAAAREEVLAQERRWFLWTDELFELFGEYEANRDDYPTFSSFLPRLADFFAELPPRVEAKLAALEAKRPKIVETTPRQDAVDVDPGSTEIQVVFDRPMQNKYYVTGTGGPDLYPNIKEIRFDESRTKLTMVVELEPETSYAIALNQPLGGSIQSDDGVLLSYTVLRFKTGAARAQR